MRKNKTYEQQKKFYDGANAYESLGEMFIYWFDCGNLPATTIQNTYRECTKECKEYIMEDLFHLCDKKQFYQFVKIFNFGKK